MRIPGKTTDLALNDVPNPKAALLPNIADQISLLREQKSMKRKTAR